MLIQAAINGTRRPGEHPAIPISPAEQASEAYGAAAAGAGAIHVHVRAVDGSESLEPGDVATVLHAIRRACPGLPVGVSTGAWIVPEVDKRLTLIRAWNVLPDFASVNFHEEGASHIAGLLLQRGIGVEAGVWHSRAAHILQRSDLANECVRILLEPAEENGSLEDAHANLDRIEHTLAISGPPRLLHGLGSTAWFFVQLAARRGYDTRIGFEDTLVLPDGSPAEDNAALVLAARDLITSAVPAKHR